MRKLFFYILTFIIIGCDNNNDISEIPFISHESISFKKSQDNIIQDSLILTINFTDGDGDLGLSNEEIYYPYHPYNAIIDENLNWITIGSKEITPPLYVYEPNGLLSLYSNEDNRPSFNCENYIIDTISSSTELDTFYIQKNENNKNIYVEFYKKVGNDFELIDWKKIFDEEYGCGIDFNSRFPPLNIGNSSQLLNGKLRYGMVSYGFDMVLKNDIFKLKVYIKDRALNQSNIIETPEVTLEEITIN
tara:strand:+ start:751 stop:1491 length:741 start_codon:yes stop_codon:yes gene_type:complete